MAYSGLPNGGNSMTTPGQQVSPQAAAFARHRLMMAQQAGALPQNFQIAKTGQNVVGQFHMLNQGLQQHQNQGADPASQHANIMDIISRLGGNNLVSRGQQPNFGDLSALLPNGGNSNPQAPVAPGQAPAGGAPGASPADLLMQMLLGQLTGSAQMAGTGAAGGAAQAQPYYNPNAPTMY